MQQPRLLFLSIHQSEQILQLEAAEESETVDAEETEIYTEESEIDTEEEAYIE